MDSNLGRRTMAMIIVIIVVLAVFVYNAFATDPCTVQHPIKPANKAFTGRCSNCGMGQAMWARTWKVFENSKQKFEVCSFTCLAKSAAKHGEAPANVKVALYHDPQTTVAAENAIFVVGSKAKGTMSKTSKLAFASRKDADEFVRTCGGEALGFQETFALAAEGIPK